MTDLVYESFARQDLIDTLRRKGFRVSFVNHGYYTDIITNASVEDIKKEFAQVIIRDTKTITVIYTSEDGSIDVPITIICEGKEV